MNENIQKAKQNVFAKPLKMKINKEKQRENLLPSEKRAKNSTTCCLRFTFNRTLEGKITAFEFVFQ